MLYVAALAEIVWDGPELARFPLAERLVRFRITEVRRSRQALPFRWSEVGYAPQFVTPASVPASLPRFTARIAVEEAQDRRRARRNAHDPLVLF